MGVVLAEVSPTAASWHELHFGLNSLLLREDEKEEKQATPGPVRGAEPSPGLTTSSVLPAFSPLSFHSLPLPSAPLQFSCCHGHSAGPHGLPEVPVPFIDWPVS